MKQNTRNHTSGTVEIVSIGAFRAATMALGLVLCVCGPARAAPEAASSFGFPRSDFRAGSYDGRYFLHPSNHLGEDSLHNHHDAVHALANGLVKKSGKAQGYGRVVVIEHTLPDGAQVCSIYGHLCGHSGYDLIPEGSEVQKGQVIGYIGDDVENEDGTEHLHLGIRKGAYDGYYYGYTGKPEGKPEKYWPPTDFVMGHGGSEALGCLASSTGVTFMEETDGCMRYFGEHWSDGDGSGGHSYLTGTTSLATVDSYGKYYFDFEEAGKYEFEVHIPDLSNLSHQAQYKFWISEQVEFVTIDQAEYAGGFPSLGVFSAQAGVGQALRLNDNTGEPNSESRVVVFDALRITPVIDVGACPIPPCGDVEAESDVPLSEDVVSADKTEESSAGGSGCQMVAGSSCASLLLLLAAIVLLLVVRLRAACALCAILLTLLTAASCSPGDEAAKQPSELVWGDDYVEVGGEKMYFMPADEQVWGDLPDSYWDDTPTFGDDLPESVDHVPFQTGIRLQEGGTCVDYAVVAGMEAFAYFQPVAPDLSEAHLEFLHEKKTLKETLLAAESYKLTTEAKWPAGTTSGKSGWKDAAKYGILEWKAISNPTDVDGLRARLAEGDKINVVISLKVLEFSWKNDSKVEPSGGKPIDQAHAVLLVGYKTLKDHNNDNKWFFRFKNSWGEDWGQSGYGWLSEDYVKQYALQAAVIRSVTDAGPSAMCGDEICASTENWSTCCTDCGCPPGKSCEVDECISCQPDCGGKECGSDGCDGTCGSCSSGWDCVQGKCECAPDCDDKECGDDECGGTCGACQAGLKCEEGSCSEELCELDCAGKECGPDGCGGDCGPCSSGWQCIQSKCECNSNCADKECGDDGCGGTCGSCSAGWQCIQSKCECSPECGSSECGDDGCGGTCGSCGAGWQCAAGQCQCVPDCAGKECGNDGCDGQCGVCLEGQSCPDGKCEDGPCVPNCEDKVCGDNGCGGSCGQCVGGLTCLNGYCWGASCTDGMCWVPAGTFKMGCNAAIDDMCEDLEYPYHEVFVDEFEIDETEVTVDEYQACVDAGSCEPPSDEEAANPKCNWAKIGKGQFPMNWVDWNDAKDYCEWAQKRLCTEAEWEKAARGTDGRKYPWGNQEPNEELAIVNNYNIGSQVVGSKPNGASPYGVLDAAGNVWEWIKDCEHDDYEGAPDDGQAWTWNCTFANRGMRGGFHGSPATMLRCSQRVFEAPDMKAIATGIRCCVAL